jgi:hypothetical protein
MVGNSYLIRIGEELPVNHYKWPISNSYWVPDDTGVNESVCDVWIF